MNPAPKGRNLAGVIPLTGRRDSFDHPWPDYLHPIRQGMLALERSVYECAYAGCDSIWIVCNDDVSPIVRKRLGDYVMSPRYFEEKNFVKNRDYHEKWVPLFYTPVSQKDRDRRDSLGWSALHGALMAFQMSEKMSSWVKPTKYFVSFPYGLYHPSILTGKRDVIRGDKSVYFEFENHTVRDNKYLSFTFFPQDWPKFKWNAKNKCTGGSRTLPAAQRWSSRSFSLSDMFDVGEIQIDEIIQVAEYHDLDTWASLEAYYRSDMKIPRPSRQFMKPYIFKGGIKE